MATTKYTIITNEWTDAQLYKPFRGRNVLVRLANGEERVLRWNGMYWITQKDVRWDETIYSRVVAWYMYEKYQKEVLS